MILQDINQGSIKISDAGKKTYEAARESVSHLRPRTSKGFLLEVEREIREAEQSTDKQIILAEAKQICELNWALVLPFFNAAKNIPADDNLIIKCSNLAQQLAVHDIDSAVTFLNRIPVALENLEDQQNLITWGEQGLAVFEAVKDKKKIWKAVKAYFIEASEANCRYPLDRWSFFLDQAIRIAAVSVDATEGFIQHGNCVCLLLNEDETIRWIDKGLGGCGSEQELINYFNGTSLKSIEASDCLVSGVPLKIKRNTLSMICEALLGQPVKLRSNTVLLGCKGFNGGAATDGHNIFLPDMAPSFGLFKLMALHQTMLLQRHPYTSLDGKILTDPARIHLDADERLIRQLPGLLHEMNEYSAAVVGRYSS
jgi:hypothetical protein